MGLTIHYSGMLRNPADLSALVAEVIDISESMKWPYHRIDRLPDVPVEGILVSPDGSEPIWLTFHEEGFMCNPLLYDYVREVEGKGIPADAEQWLFTKTQYAGAEAHMAMIRLLRYLSTTYFERFELHDESHFWETNDEDACRKRFGEYDKIMSMVGDALDEMEIDPNATQESIVSQIEEVLEKRFGMKRKE